MLMLRFPLFPWQDLKSITSQTFPYFTRNPGAAPKDEDEDVVAVLPHRCLSWGIFHPAKGKEHPK